MDASRAVAPRAQIARFVDDCISTAANPTDAQQASLALCAATELAGGSTSAHKQQLGTQVLYTGLLYDGKNYRVSLDNKRLAALRLPLSEIYHTTSHHSHQVTHLEI